MKNFIGAKIIQAEPMDEVTFLLEFKGLDPQEANNRETRSGYRVIYPPVHEGDKGYVSWSPKNVFETAYREITDGEEQMLGVKKYEGDPA